MSFAFNPNDYIDRPKVDNDPQDHSLGGEGRLVFDQVPGESQVGSAITSQGQGPGGLSQGQAFDRQGQAQGLARGGLYQAQEGPAYDCWTSLRPTRFERSWRSTISCLCCWLSSIHLCVTHKQILWDYSPPCGWNQCLLGYMSQACSWNPWLPWLCSSSRGC